MASRSTDTDAGPASREAIEPVTGTNKDTRPFAWAGLFMKLPVSHRLVRTEGDARRGSLVLADAERARLQISWAAVTKRRFDAERFLRRRLTRATGKRFTGSLVSLDHGGFRPLLMHTDEQAGVDRCAGFCPATSRVVEWVFYHGEEGLSDLAREAILASTRDQPLDQPARWCFFDTSFIAPAGFAYRSATLNLGDMRVSLAAGPHERSGPGVSIRSVYPAALALARQPLEAWHADWLRVFRKAFRFPGMGFWSFLSRGQPVVIEETTPRGGMLVTDTRARIGVRLRNWRMPPRARLCTLHDQTADRIVTLCAAAGHDRVGPLTEELLAGLQWAAVAD